MQQIEAGEIRNHADVRAALAELDGLEFKPLTDKQLEKRRKADAEEARGGKPRRHDTRITMRVAGTSDSQNTLRLEDRIFHEDWTADEYFAAKPASEGRDANPRDRIHDRTANQVEEQARKIRQATAELEASRKEWRTVTWKTMLPTYLAGVLLTFWVLLMAVQLTFPEPQNTTPELGLASFGLEGARVTHGPGRLGRVLSLPRGVTLADCPIPNLNGGEVCVETATTR
ncbi:MAG: hypothetical protein CSA68_12570 [Rhodobacterales bacterium]|nr:MAG: hypothetical protein CSA68_12570 [Rhodobacterales bacterium]